MRKVILGMVILFSLIVVMVHFNTPEEPTAWKEYIVCSGDTLFDISQSITSDDRDCRETEYFIKKKNNIVNATIYPGQTIFVPVYE